LKAAAESTSSDLPDALDRGMIVEAIAKVKTRAQACGDKSSAKGQVKLSVKVSPAGNVSSVTLRKTPDLGLGNCVARVMQTAKLVKTQHGGSFQYPFSF